MVGSLLFGVLYDRYNRHIMLAVCTFGFAVFNGVKPFCSVFPVMVAVQLLNYIFSGGLDTGRFLNAQGVKISYCIPVCYLTHIKLETSKGVLWQKVKT